MAILKFAVNYVDLYFTNSGITITFEVFHTCEKHTNELVLVDMLSFEFL